MTREPRPECGQEARAGLGLRGAGVACLWRTNRARQTGRRQFGPRTSSHKFKFPGGRGGFGARRSSIKFELSLMAGRSGARMWCTGTILSISSDKRAAVRGRCGVERPVNRPYRSWKLDVPVMYGCTLLSCKPGSKIILNESNFKSQFALKSNKTNKMWHILTQEFHFWWYILSTAYVRTPLLN